MRLAVEARCSPMAAIIFGGMILAWTAMMALRSLMRLAGLGSDELQDLVAPGVALVVLVPLLAMVIPGTGLIDEGRGWAAVYACLAATAILLFLPARHLLNR